MNPAVFIDRDGTLNACVVRAGKPYPPGHLDEFELLPRAAEACAALKAAGFRLIVVTNQPDVARGTQSQAMVEALNQRLSELIPTIDRIEVCYAPGRGVPHAEDYRRKPEPGMLLDAAAALDIDLSRSWMVGDRGGDIDAGHAAGCRTVLVGPGYDEPESSYRPDFQTPSFAAAADTILASL